MTALFDYHPDILDRFPTIRAGVIHVTGLSNPPSSPELRQEYVTEQGAVVAGIGQTPLADLPAIGAWRRAFSSFLGLRACFACSAAPTQEPRTSSTRSSKGRS